MNSVCFPWLQKLKCSTLLRLSERHFLKREWNSQKTDVFSQVSCLLRLLYQVTVKGIVSIFFPFFFFLGSIDNTCVLPLAACGGSMTVRILPRHPSLDEISAIESNSHTMRRRSMSFPHRNARHLYIHRWINRSRDNHVYERTDGVAPSRLESNKNECHKLSWTSVMLARSLWWSKKWQQIQSIWWGKCGDVFDARAIDKTDTQSGVDNRFCYGVPMCHRVYWNQIQFFPPCLLLTKTIASFRQHTKKTHFCDFRSHFSHVSPYANLPIDLFMPLFACLSCSIFLPLTLRGLWI